MSGMPKVADPNVLVGFDTADDAGVYRLNEETAIVQTIDFFTPIVDDPRTYGRIAAANALSDVYAMGGVPRFALSVVGFPKEGVEEEILAQIVLGGAEKMREADVPIIGGHSVQDQEIKFGYCVSGFVHPSKIYTNSGARPGDVLLLSKPLGSGIIATGIKFQKVKAAAAAAAVDWMLKLNGDTSRFLGRYPVHAVTDITGFGLVGHAYEMARGSAVTVEFEAEAVPLMEGVADLARKGMLPAGIESNRAYVGENVSWNRVSRTLQQFLLDPQTSGGLLISLPEEAAGRLQAEAGTAGTALWRIGRVTERQDYLLKFR